MQVSDILYKAADLIEPEGAWTTDAEAREAEEGAEVDPLDPSAACFCVGGAIWRVAPGDLRWPAAHYLESLVGGDIPEWNDAPERTQAEVVAKLREAAALAREQGR